MALLGINWHSMGPITLAPVTGGAVNVVAYAGYQHSLGPRAGAPDIVIPMVRSVGGLANAVNGFLGFAQIGGNASQVTVGPIIGSIASHPTIAFDLYAAHIWSAAR
jgi:hypothetical protein